MNRLLVLLAVNILLGSLVSLLLSLTIINSAELRIASASFLLIGIAMLPIGLGAESRASRILQIEAEAFKQNTRRILEEFLIHDKKMYLCPSTICKATSILLPIGRVSMEYTKPANRFITVYKDKLMVMLEIPIQKILKSLLEEVGKNVDLNTLNALIKELLISLIGSSVEVFVSKRDNKYRITVNKISDKIEDFESWIIIASLIGSTIAEMQKKPILLDNYVYEHGTLNMELVEV